MTVFWLTAPAFAVLCAFVNVIVKGIRRKVILRNREKLRLYEERANNSKNELQMLEESYGAEWHSTCETFEGYPPDWDERCSRVKSRDGHKCTECGYPVGLRRRTRELHIHHITPISEGGTNELDNLITLCHICHRGVNSKHRAVRRINKIRSRGRLRKPQ